MRYDEWMTTRRSYAGRSAADRLADRRARLLDAAISLYGLNGYRNTSIRAVCQSAGLTERFFYEAFPNSEALLTAAFETSVDNLLRLMTPLATAAVDSDQEARVRDLLTAYYGRVAASPVAARLFLVETVGVSAELDRLFEGSLVRLTEPLVEICDPARSGRFSRLPLLRRGVAGGLLHIATAWIESGFESRLADVVEAALPIAMLCRR